MEEVTFISGACSVGSDTRNQTYKGCFIQSETKHYFTSEFVLLLLFTRSAALADMQW